MKKDIYNKAEMLAEIVETMCGSINPIGLKNYDNKVFENLDTLIEVVNILLDDIQMSMSDAKREIMYDSVEKIYKKEHKFFVALREQIDELLNPDRECE